MRCDSGYLSLNRGLGPRSRDVCISWVRFMGSPWRRRWLIKKLPGSGHDGRHIIGLPPPVFMLDVFGGGSVEALLLGLQPGTTLVVL